MFSILRLFWRFGEITERKCKNSDGGNAGNMLKSLGIADSLQNLTGSGWPLSIGIEVDF
jgi:hypothetical protein